jgi:hypothetical protein
MITRLAMAVTDAPSASSSTAGRYQGAHSRHQDRVVLGLCLAIIWVYSLTQDWHSVSLCVRATVSLLFVGLILEWAIVRRRGFSIGADGLILHYAFYRRTIRWEEIEGFERGPWIYSRMMTYLWVRTPKGGVRVPSASYAENTWMGKAAARYLSSRNVRGRGGGERDALQTADQPRGPRGLPA